MSEDRLMSMEFQLGLKIAGEKMLANLRACLSCQSYRSGIAIALLQSQSVRPRAVDTTRYFLLYTLNSTASQQQHELQSLQKEIARVLSH